MYLCCRMISRKGSRLVLTAATQTYDRRLYSVLKKRLLGHGGAGAGGIASKVRLDSCISRRAVIGHGHAVSPDSIKSRTLAVTNAHHWQSQGGNGFITRVLSPMQLHYQLLRTCLSALPRCSHLFSSSSLASKGI